MTVLRNVSVVLAVFLGGCQMASNDAAVMKAWPASDGLVSSEPSVRPVRSAKRQDVVGTVGVSADTADGPVENQLSNWNASDEKLRRATVICRGC